MVATNLRQAETSAGDPRVEEILDQAREAFVRKGFDGASMQDLARAAGMSAGNFYRYFPSKAALVEALVARDLDEVERDFHEVLSAPVPLDALRAGLRMRIAEECANRKSLWAEIMAAAARKPEIAAALDGMERDIRDKLTRVFARASGLPLEEAQARFGGHARFLMMLFRGVSLEKDDDPTGASDLKRLIERTIDMAIDEITEQGPKS